MEKNSAVPSGANHLRTPVASSDRVFVTEPTLDILDVQLETAWLSCCLFKLSFVYQHQLELLLRCNGKESISQTEACYEVCGVCEEG